MIFKIYLWELWGAIFTCVLGTTFHFAYKWFGEKKPLALFFAVNESVWEHCKIAFWPAFFYTMVEYFFIGNVSYNFITAKAIMLTSMVLIIIAGFYTYTGILGKHIFIIDLLLFYFAIIFSYYISFNIIVSVKLPEYINTISLVIIMLLITAFSTLTFNPIHIPLFKDSQSGQYGIPK